MYFRASTNPCIVLAISVLVLGLSGCGGGGGGGGAAPSPTAGSGATVSQVTLKASAPAGSWSGIGGSGSGVRNVPPGQAVRLLLVDAVGDVLEVVHEGTVLAADSTATINLATPRQASAAFVAEVTMPSSNVVRSQITGAQTIVDHLGEYVMMKMVAATKASGTKAITDFTANDVLYLRSQVEAAGVDITSSIDDAAELETAIDKEIGGSDALDTTMDRLMAGGTVDTSALTGTFNCISQCVEMDACPVDDVALNGTELHSFQMTLGGFNGSAGLVSSYTGTEYDYEQNGFPGGSGGAHYSVDREVESEILTPNWPVEAFADGGFTVLVPTETRFETEGADTFWICEHGYRREFFPIGPNAYVGHVIGRDTGHTVAGGVIDPTPMMQSFGRHFDFAARRGPINVAALQGRRYGCVGMGCELYDSAHATKSGQRSFWAFVCSPTLSVAGNVVTIASNDNVSEFDRIPSATDLTATFQGSYDVLDTDSYQITVDPSTATFTESGAPPNAEAMGGFFSTDGNYIFETAAENNGTSLYQAFAISGPRPTGAPPVVDGSTYRCLFVQVEMSTGGAQNVNFNSGSVEATFGGGQVTFTGSSSQIGRLLDHGAPLTEDTDSSTDGPYSYTTGDTNTGNIWFDDGGSPSEEFRGWISADGRVIILRSQESTPSERQLGVLVLVRK